MKTTSVQVTGRQCGDCVVEVVEEEGEILSWQQKTISIAFTALKPVSLYDTFFSTGIIFVIYYYVAIVVVQG